MQFVKLCSTSKSDRRENFSVKIHFHARVCVPKGYESFLLQHFEANCFCNILFVIQFPSFSSYAFPEINSAREKSN